MGGYEDKRQNRRDVSKTHAKKEVDTLRKEVRDSNSGGFSCAKVKTACVCEGRKKESSLLIVSNLISCLLRSERTQHLRPLCAINVYCAL